MRSSQCADRDLVSERRHKKSRISHEMRDDVNLATSYFRIAFRHTIIGATAFHFRVRNGNGWYHCAMVTRLRLIMRVRHMNRVSGDTSGSVL